MSKKRRLSKGGLTDQSHLNTRYHPDSVIKRRDRYEEEETGVTKRPPPWTPDEDDFVLDCHEKGILDAVKEGLPWRTVRARRIRVQHLASCERKYVGTQKRRYSRVATSWTRWDERIAKMAITPAALRNGTTVEYLARLLAREEHEVPTRIRVLLEREHT